MPPKRQARLDAPRSNALVPFPHQRELIDALTNRSASAVAGTRLLIALATGGGKNLVSNDFIWESAIGTGKRVLRITMNWELTAQTAKDLCTRHEGATGLVSYVGAGSAPRVMGDLRQGADGQVVFATIHTWTARKNKEFANQEFDIVMIDECHWGEGAALYGRLLARYEARAFFVGLTATPRRWTSFERVGPSYDLPALVDAGFLPRPHVHRVRTGIEWTPFRSSRSGDYSAGSLRELGASAKRDALIVATYVANRQLFKRGILFACGISHAESLVPRFRRKRVRTAAIHCKLSHEEREAVVARFRRGELDVLINVVSLIHGFDVPDVDTVLLCRPTMSDILMAQMIGRGSRRAAGKTQFHVVDFVDNVRSHGAPVLRPDGFIGSRLLPGARGPLRGEHEHDATPIEVFPAIPGYELLEGLPLQPTQTFGIEFELTDLTGGRRAWSPLALKLLEAIRNVVPCGAKPLRDARVREDHCVWNVKPDASCGWEITSRILRGPEGFIEIADACAAIERSANELGLGVSVKTGTHVHLGWRSNASHIRHLMEIAAYYEPAIVSLVGPSRATTQYATSVRQRLREMKQLETLADWDDYFSDEQTRYMAVSPRGLFHGHGTVEVRLHSGTIDAPKILTWVSLWMLMLAAAGEGRPLQGSAASRLYSKPLCPAPRGDVAHLSKYLRDDVRFERRLVERRDYVIAHWWVHDTRYTDLVAKVWRSWASAQLLSDAAE